MSIAIKKFLTMLNQEVLSDGDLNDGQKEVLKKVCERIYLLETTSNSTQIPSQITAEIKDSAVNYTGKI